MCGRYVSTQSDQDLVKEFDVEEIVGDPPPPSWNVAPTDPARIVVNRHPSQDRATAPLRQLRTAQWGLLPSWSRSRSGGAKMINARSETVASKPAFRSAAARRRGLAPSLGYFEWQNQGGRKTPYFLHAPDEHPLAMAALYEIWRDDSLPEDDPNRWVWSYSIVTRPASDTLGHIHDRCPVLIPPQMQAQWLDCRADDPLVAQSVLAEIPEPNLQPRQVSNAVGNVRNNGPELIEPVEDAPVDEAVPPLTLL